jgi:aspartyl-tRNA(Asn)/glutamyl-tRNA(Gln) amidotransferase subunit A
MASSFDQVGTLTKTVADARLLLATIAGYDSNDVQTEKKSDEKGFLVASNRPASEIRIAVPNEAFNEALDTRVEKLFREKLEELKRLGYQVDRVDFPILQQVAPIYYLLISAEVTSNLSRFDGMRFGHQGSMSAFSSLQEYYTTMRKEGFGNEVKKRLLLGNYVVTHENYEKYYLKGYQARKYLQSEFSKFFQTYHVIATPATPTPAGKVGEKVHNSLLMYLEDLYTVPANLGGLPAISLPMGTITEDDGELPVGIQLMGPKWQEGLLLDIAEGIEYKSS